MPAVAETITTMTDQEAMLEMLRHGPVWWLRVFDPDNPTQIPTTGLGPAARPFVEVFQDELADPKVTPEELRVRLGIRLIRMERGDDVRYTAADVGGRCGMPEERVARILRRVAKKGHSGATNGQGQLFD